MTERDFYKTLLADELGSERLLEDIKNQSARKRPFNTWARAAAAVFCVILLGSIGVVIAGHGLKAKDSAETCNEIAAYDSTPAPAVHSEANFENRAVAEDAYSNSSSAGEAELLHERQLHALSSHADCIVTAVMSGENELTVIKGIRGAQAGQKIKTAYCELPEGEEYLLFLIKDVNGYVPLLTGKDGVYRADSAAGEYWLRGAPDVHRPIAEIENLA